MSGLMRLAALIGLSLLFWFTAGAAQAHELRPSFLRVTEVSAGEFEVVLKQAIPTDGQPKISATFPQACTHTGARLDQSVDTMAERFTLNCDLRRGVISLSGLERGSDDIFVEIAYLDEDILTTLLKADDPVLSLDGPQASPAADYLWIGVEHILFGWDHLLFVIGLTLLVAGRRVWAVATAFTVAHTLTLAATAMGGVSLPSRPVEILIAASIILLAVEIMAQREGRKTLGAKRPFLIAFTVGLIHGFGFAGALAEIGLPQGTELLALLLFNLGVELGQFAVIGLFLLVLLGLTRLGPRPRRRAETFATYAIAAIAVVWVIERAAQYWV